MAKNSEQYVRENKKFHIAPPVPGDDDPQDKLPPFDPLAIVEEEVEYLEVNAQLTAESYEKAMAGAEIIADLFEQDSTDTAIGDLMVEVIGYAVTVDVIGWNHPLRTCTAPYLAGKGRAHHERQAAAELNRAILPLEVGIPHQNPYSRNTWSYTPTGQHIYVITRATDPELGSLFFVDWMDTFHKKAYPHLEVFQTLGDAMDAIDHKYVGWGLMWDEKDTI